MNETLSLILNYLLASGLIGTLFFYNSKKRKALVPASAEIIAQRQAVQALANHAATRKARQQRYDSEAITSLYWNWQESGAKADKAKWLAAKEAIRQELPYPETPTAV